MEEDPPQLTKLQGFYAKNVVQSALLAQVVAAIEAQNPPRSLFHGVDFEEALNQADMAITGGMKKPKACEAAAAAALHAAKQSSPSAAKSAKPPAAPFTRSSSPPADEGATSQSLWSSLAGFHEALADYPKCRAFFINGNLWNEKGRLTCDASIGDELLSTLKLEPRDPKSGFVACLVPTFYSGLLEAFLASLLSSNLWLTLLGGILAAYAISACLYLAVVTTAERGGADDTWSENFTSQERYQYGVVAVGLLCLFDLVLAFQIRSSLLTTPFYTLKAALAGLMVVQGWRLSKESELAAEVMA